MGKTPFLDYESPALTIELRAQTKGKASCFFDAKSAFYTTDHRVAITPD